MFNLFLWITLPISHDVFIACLNPLYHLAFIRNYIWLSLSADASLQFIAFYWLWVSMCWCNLMHFSILAIFHWGLLRTFFSVQISCNRVNYSYDIYFPLLFFLSYFYLNSSSLFPGLFQSSDLHISLCLVFSLYFNLSFCCCLFSYLILLLTLLSPIFHTYSVVWSCLLQNGNFMSSRTFLQLIFTFNICSFISSLCLLHLLHCTFLYIFHFQFSSFIVLDSAFLSFL